MSAATGSAQPLRWGILGPGWIAAKALAPAMRAAGHELVAVGSRSLPRALAFAVDHGVARAHGTYAAVLEDADVDAVYIALPNDAHELWTIAALDAGKDVLCEKPLCLNAAAVERVAAAQRRTGRQVMEAVMTRFHPRTTALLDLVAAGGVGVVRHVHVTFSFPMGKRDNYRALPQHGGGALLDVGLYAVSSARWIVGEEPDAVAACQRVWDSGVDGSTTALLDFPGGALATLYASFEAAEEQRIEVVGTEATVTVPHAFTSPSSEDAVLLRDEKPIGSWRADQYQLMVEAFAAAVATGASPPLSVESSLGTARVLDQIRTAAQAGTRASATGPPATR